MLEIYVDNQKIDLPIDIEVNVTWENPFLLQDRIPLSYSMSFELPFSNKNLAIFKNPNRVNSVGSWNKFGAQLRFRNVTFGIGTIELNEVQTKLSTNYIGSNIPDLVKNKLSDLETVDDFLHTFGEGSRFFPDFTTGWAKVYKDFIFSNATTGSKFAACPMRVKDEDWRYEADSYGMFNADTLYFNMWNVNNGSYVFSEDSIPVHGVIFPQPYIYYLIDQVFGDALNDNFFYNTPELRNLALVTSFHQMYSESIMSTYHGILVDNSYLDADNHMNLSSFMSTYSFSELLKEWMKMFCCSLLPRPDGKLDIVHNKAIIENDEIIDWRTKLVGTPTIRLQRGQNYTYGFNGESEVSEEQHYTAVQSIESLLQADKVEGMYQVDHTGEVYDKKLKYKALDTDPDEYEYERKETGLGGNKAEKSDDVEDYSMNSSVSPIPMCIDEYWFLNFGITKYPWYVPQFPDDRKKNDSAPYLGFMRGFYDLAGKFSSDIPYNYDGKYPLMTPYAYDMNGNNVGNYSLAWEGTDGLITSFHTEFKAWIENDHLILRGKFRLTELDLKNIDYMKKYYVHGRRFYLKKIEATLTRSSISLCDVEMIEA